MATTKAKKLTALKTLGYTSLMEEVVTLDWKESREDTLTELLPEEGALVVELTDGTFASYQGEMTKHKTAESVMNELNMEGEELGNYVITPDSINGNGAEVRRVVTELFASKKNQNLADIYFVVNNEEAAVDPNEEDDDEDLEDDFDDEDEEA